MIWVVYYQNKTAEFDNRQDAYMFCLTLNQDFIEYSFRGYGKEYYLKNYKKFQVDTFTK